MTFRISPIKLIKKSGLEKHRVENSLQSFYSSGHTVFMGLNDLPEHVRQFVFEYVDSVEQLEVLLFLRAHRNHSYDSNEISKLLRSNPQSVMKRILILESCDFVVRHEPAESDGKDTLRVQYSPRNIDIDNTIEALADLYKTKPQKILEVIFSPLKKGRQFANAFLVKASKKDPEDG